MATTQPNVAPQLSDIERCGLQRKTPYAILNVSQTMFSVARHYGRADYNGDSYTYFPSEDMLVRNDVLRWCAAEGKL